MERRESLGENAGYSITMGFTVVRAEKLHLTSPCTNGQNKRGPSCHSSAGLGERGDVPRAGLAQGCSQPELSSPSRALRVSAGAEVQ